VLANGSMSSNRSGEGQIPKNLIAALLDRLLHRCHVFNVKGRSYRLRDLERSLKQ